MQLHNEVVTAIAAINLAVCRPRRGVYACELRTCRVKRSMEMLVNHAINQLFIFAGRGERNGSGSCRSKGKRDWRQRILRRVMARIKSILVIWDHRARHLLIPWINATWCGARDRPKWYDVVWTVIRTRKFFFLFFPNYQNEI